MWYRIPSYCLWCYDKEVTTNPNHDICFNLYSILLSIHVQHWIRYNTLRKLIVSFISKDSIISHINVGTTTAFKTQVDAIIYSLIVGDQCTQNLLSTTLGIFRGVG